jgi:hypothetical protein
MVSLVEAVPALLLLHDMLVKQIPETRIMAIRVLIAFNFRHGKG